ncbi:MAG: CHAT domain-containing protein [Lewinellaceae bacterium]|nr:CHAT domain-containing protein [Lewinellaceae bacterium]
MEYMIGFERLWSLTITKDSALVASTTIDSSFYGLIEDYVNYRHGQRRPQRQRLENLLYQYFSRSTRSLRAWALKISLSFPTSNCRRFSLKRCWMPRTQRPAPLAIMAISSNAITSDTTIPHGYLPAQQQKTGTKPPPARKPFAGFTSGLPDPTLGTVSCGRTRLSELEKVTEQTRISYFPESGDFFAYAQDSAFTTQAGQYSILQLALHGCSSPGSNSEFFLEFRPKPGNEENHLELPEIYSLDLFSQLTVLSNCHTARGQACFRGGHHEHFQYFCLCRLPQYHHRTLSSVPDQSTAQILNFFMNICWKRATLPLSL